MKKVSLKAMLMSLAILSTSVACLPCAATYDNKFSSLTQDQPVQPTETEEEATAQQGPTSEQQPEQPAAITQQDTPLPLTQPEQPEQPGQPIKPSTEEISQQEQEQIQKTPTEGLQNALFQEEEGKEEQEQENVQYTFRTESDDDDSLCSIF